MKKLINFILVFILTFFISILPVSAKDADTIKIYFFHGDGCPHCAEEEEFFKDNLNDYDNVEIVEYEVWYDEDNAEFMKKVSDELEINTTGVPLTIIGKNKISGFAPAAGDKILRAIKYYSENDYVDVVEQIKNGTYLKENNEDGFTEQEKKSDESSIVDVPILGKINMKKTTIGTAAIVIGLVDGFNPCAMWVLLFLISVLIGMKDKKRMWTYGLTFLISSALVYMAIMLAWISVVVKVTTSILIRNIIAIVAIIGAFINFKSYHDSQESGCKVTSNNKRKKIFDRIKKFTHEKSFFLGLIGVIGLAVSVNLIELACSAGLPLIFTQLLAINNITGINAFLYTLLYIFFFLIDDLIVFFIAMFTMKVTGISTKYNKYSHLIGGILMLIIGVLLLVKPEWLMFQFK